EGALLLAHDLVVLVPLAGDQHRVPGPRRTQRQLDGLAAIRYDAIARQTHPRVPRIELRLAAAGQARLDVREDGCRILGARVVAGGDDQVRAAARGLAHQGTLAAVAVAAASEDADDARRSGVAECVEHPRQRVVGV